jgi:hypothetical protein
MTQVAEFKVVHLYPPYQGKGLAAVVAHDGTKYKCQESQLAQFREGEDVAINYTDESFRSKTGETVSFKKLVSKIVRGNGGAVQKQITKARMDPADARGAFITVILQAFIATGKVPLNAESIFAAREQIGRGYDMNYNPQHADDLNDEIPY